MTPSPNHNAAEDLALIRQMMQAGRKRLSIDGNHFVIWGAILSLAFFAQYIQAIGYFSGSMLWIWLPAFAVGTICEIFLSQRETQPADGPSVTVTAYSAAWGAVGITMMLHFASSFAGGVFDARTIAVLTCGAFASAFFLIARVTELKLLNLVAFGWWALLVYTSVRWSFDREMLLVLAGACALLILLPGQIMRRLASTDATKG